MAECMQKQIRRIYAVGAKDLIWEMELELSWHPRDTWEVSSGSIGGKKKHPGKGQINCNLLTTTCGSSVGRSKVR